MEYKKRLWLYFGVDRLFRRLLLAGGQKASTILRPDVFLLYFPPFFSQTRSWGLYCGCGLMGEVCVRGGVGGGW